jgi:hypothetical protein
MAEIPVHVSSRALVTSFMQKPAHALILQSSSLQALKHTAELIITSILNITQTEDNPAVLLLPKKNSSVSIEEIREIQKFVKLKTVGSKAIRRVICISHAERMSSEAQNALLKVLEEPPLDTILLVCTKSVDELLPTIRSRAQKIALKNPTYMEYLDVYAEQDPGLVKKAYLMSDGMPEVMEAILKEESENTNVADINLAKQILSANTYDKLIQVELISKNKSAQQILKAMENICYAALKQSAGKNAASSEQWAHRLKLILNAEQDLTFNVSSKIVLTDLFLQM